MSPTVGYDKLVKDLLRITALLFSVVLNYQCNLLLYIVFLPLYFSI